MTEKVKLTREQAEALDKMIEFAHGDKEAIINGHNRDWAQDEFEPLNQMTVAKIAKALYIGYEVEETFKVGEWVVLRRVPDGAETDTYKITSINEGYVYLDNIYGQFRVEEIRHATPEEIAKEKERRWWAKHGRNVWELRRHDLISDKDGCSYTVNLIKEDYVDYVEFVEFGMRKKTKEVKESFKVICFAEDRKDVEQ